MTQVSKLRDYCEKVGETMLATKNNLNQVEAVMRMKVQQVKASQDQ
jgi:hypothetical protein